MSILFGKKTIVYLIVLFIDFVSVGAAGKEKKKEKRGEYGLLRGRRRKKTER